MLRVRYGQVSGDIRSFGTARCAQAQACLSTGARVTVILMTFRVLAQGGRGVSWPDQPVAGYWGAVKREHSSARVHSSMGTARRTTTSEHSVCHVLTRKGGGGAGRG